MSGVQMLLSVVAVMIFGIIGTNLQETILENEASLRTNSTSQEAASVGRALIDEIQTKFFDAANASNKVVRLADLTPANSLGKGSWEVYPSINDVDDYHNMMFTSPAPGVMATSSTPRALRSTEGYTVTCRVVYVNPDNPSTTSSTATFAKRVTLRISNTYSADTLTMSYISTY